FLLYFLALILRSRSQTQTVARTVWTMGCLCLAAHFVCAFHFFHDWSHNIAYQVTAKQTAEAVGLNWGGGIYVNYAVVVVWAADAVWWWASGATYLARSRLIEWTVQGFLGFMFFNATVVFGHGIIRLWGLVAFFVLGLLVVLRRAGAK